MTDGDVSHSSEIRLLSWRTGVDLDFFSCWFSFLLCLFVLRLALFRLLFPYQWGSSPEWVKPTAEGEALFLLFFALTLLAFYDVKLLVLLGACILST
jgi:hypothetical protein